MSTRTKIVDAYRTGGADSVLTLVVGHADYLLSQYWRVPYLASKPAVDIRVVDNVAQFHSADRRLASSLNFFRRSEKKLAEHLFRDLTSNDVFFDIGANVGLYSCLAADSGCSVYAFEPFPANIDVLKKNIELNDSDITTFEIALSDTNSTVSIESDVGSTQTTGCAHIAASGSEDDVLVDTVRGDSLVEESKAQQPTVVKIDVEGAEGAVIEGLSDSLSDPMCSRIYCEVHLQSDVRPSCEDFGYSYDEIRTMLEEMGFELEELEIRGQEIHLFGQK